MKKAIFILTIIFCVFGCKKETPEPNGISVNLIADDNPAIFRKSVTLFDDASYLVKTPLDTFLTGYPFKFLHGYDDMKAKAISDSVFKDLLILSDYMKYPHDRIYTLAYYLETGGCYFFDKQAKSGIKTILVETYVEGEPMMMRGGRRFYVKDKLFLETVDMMSK